MNKPDKQIGLLWYSPDPYGDPSSVTSDVPSVNPSSDPSEQQVGTLQE